MKVYCVIDNRMMCADAPDGAMCMEIGAREDPHRPAIDEFDRVALEFRRQGEPSRPFPAKYYRTRDLEWTPTAVQETRSR